MDHERFLGEMKRAAAAFRVDLTAPTIAAYWVQMHGADEKAFHEAVSRAIDSGTRFPLVADLTRLMLRIAEEWKTYAPQYALADGTGTVACLTCMDAGYVRRDLPTTHPEFGKAIRCPHCNANGGGAVRGDMRAMFAAHLERERAEIARLRPYREEQAARRRYAPVASDFPDAEPPPEGFARRVQQSAEQVPVPFCMTPFVIVPKAKDGRRGFIAQWATVSDRAARGDACDWRASREAVRSYMVSVYADIAEVKA